MEWGISHTQASRKVFVYNQDQAIQKETTLVVFERDSQAISIQGFMSPCPLGYIRADRDLSKVYTIIHNPQAIQTTQQGVGYQLFTVRTCLNLVLLAPSYSAAPCLQSTTLMYLQVSFPVKHIFECHKRRTYRNLATHTMYENVFENSYFCTNNILKNSGMLW